MTDGWGDASGIEGNYEGEDSEIDSSEVSEMGETAEPTSSTGTRESSGTSKTNRTSKTNETKTNIRMNGTGGRSTFQTVSSMIWRIRTLNLN